MIEDQLETAIHASEDKRANMIHELASHPDDTLELTLSILNRSVKKYWGIAAQVIHTIGYPGNALAIPTLIEHIGDQNSLAWQEAVKTLVDIGPDVVVSYLIQSIWDKNRHVYWGADVEGICAMLVQVNGEYASRCGPVLAYLLAQEDLPSPHDLDKSSLLDVLATIGPVCAVYALPPLLHLVQKEGTSDIGIQARNLILSFDKQALEPYIYVLEALHIP